MTCCLVLLTVLAAACTTDAESATGTVTIAPAATSSPTVGTTVPSPSAASGTPPTSDPSPDAVTTTEMSHKELVAWAEEAVAFVDRFHANYRDAEATFAGFADDANLFDPSNGDYSVNDKADLVSSWQGFADGFPDLEMRTRDVFVSPVTVAARVDVFGLWPSEPIPPDARIPEIRLFRFEDGMATSFELSYGVDWLEAYAATCGGAEDCGACFVPETNCGSDLRDLVKKYLEAWSSGDEEAIASLYADDATFTDPGLGIEATGASVIAAIGDGRFWSGHDVCEPLHVYAQTFGGEGDGRIIGVGIHYRCYPGSPGPWSLEGLAMLELGTRLPDGFEPDPDGLIVREEVLQDAEDLIRASS
jgi:ketosteroid isomerase-like protein